nr:MAG TPA: hypothetical protein [Caudoviricetes sp.]
MTKTTPNFITTLKTTLIASTEITIPDKENFVFNLLVNLLSDDELKYVEELKIFSNIKSDLSNLPLKLYNFVMRKMDLGDDLGNIENMLVLEMFNAVDWVAGRESNEMAYKFCCILERFANFVKSERDTWY